MAKTRALIADGRLQVLSGEDHQIFSTVAEGGVGAIAASGHVQTQALRAGAAPPGRQPRGRSARRMAAVAAADRDAVRRIEPRPVKALLAHAGAMRDELRSPMTRASDGLRERLVALDARLSRP
jgi:4-hydroxy-tetrahydrodipicolinate synthase